MGSKNLRSSRLPVRIMMVLRLLAIRRRLKDLIVILLGQLQFGKLLHIGHCLGRGLLFHWLHGTHSSARLTTESFDLSFYTKQECNADRRFELFALRWREDFSFRCYNYFFSCCPALSSPTVHQSHTHALLRGK